MSTASTQIKVRVDVPCWVPELAPAKNRVGMLMLYRQLRNALRLAGMVGSDDCSMVGGHLNDCLFTAVVSDEAKALEVLSSELREVALLRFCQIGVSRGDRFECVHPSPDLKLDFIFCDEHREQAFEQFREQAKIGNAKVRDALATIKEAFGGQL